MSAQTRKEFINSWEDQARLLTLLGNSVKKPETWEEIKDVRELVCQLIHKVADEAFGVEEKNQNAFN